MVCPQCSSAVQPTDCFCEGCGTSLGKQRETPASTEASSIPQCSCGGTRFDSDNFCQNCGKKQEVYIPITWESVDKTLAWATHPGRTHSVNQDAVSVRKLPSGTVLMAVADGVSNAERAQEAALTAVKTVLEELATEDCRDPQKSLEEAVYKAHQQLKLIPYTDSKRSEPEATIVTAIIRERQIWFAWVGDSRIYALNNQGGRQLTEDDSWFNSALHAGTPLDPAMARRNLHSITQCLGMRDEPPEIHVASAELEPNSWLILCSDGLWNYFSQPEALLSAIATPGFEGSAVELCKTWVEGANIRGGQDNISVAALRIML